MPGNTTHDSRKQPEMGFGQFKKLSEGDDFTIKGVDWHVHRVHDEYGPAPAYDRVLDCTRSSGARRLIIVYPREVRMTMSFTKMNKGEYETIARAADPRPVTDGGPVESKTERLDRIQDQVSEINRITADIITSLSAVNSHPSPETTIRRVQMDLIDLFADAARTLDIVEHYLDDYDDSWETPRHIVSDHGDRLKEQYDGPVLNLALMLLENNRRKWLHRKEGTNGADTVRRHGLTGNQRSWLNTLNDAYNTENHE